MTSLKLEHALSCANDSESCVAAIARYFESHPLHYGHGTDNATDEAYWLVRAVQGWDDERYSARPDAATRQRVVEVARARVEQRRPLAYLLGEAWFAGLRFVVDERVLVPRSPLAELIESRYAPWCRLEPGDRMLDIGTGSGCIAIASAVHCPGVFVDATDNSQGALALAAQNAASLAPDGRLTLLEADLFAPGRGPYRLVVSNPPYVPTARVAELPEEYRHEPVAGLDGGVDGLAAVRRLLSLAASYLEPGGVLIVEVGEAQDAFAAAYPSLPVTWLEFAHGGEGVFVVSREQLTGHSSS
jgi:ribosomal protein L3 glutamine methyltransferase